jgi:hypothetical protein
MAVISTLSNPVITTVQIGGAPTERHGVLTIQNAEGAEGDYVDRLFSFNRVWINW